MLGMLSDGEESEDWSEWKLYGGETVKGLCFVLLIYEFH